MRWLGNMVGVHAEQSTAQLRHQTKQKENILCYIIAISFPALISYLGSPELFSDLNVRLY